MKKKTKMRFTADEMSSLGDYVNNAKSEKLMKVFLKMTQTAVAFHSMITEKKGLPGDNEYNQPEKAFEKALSELKSQLRKRNVIFNVKSDDGFFDPVKLVNKIYDFSVGK